MDFHPTVYIPEGVSVLLTAADEKEARKYGIREARANYPEVPLREHILHVEYQGAGVWEVVVEVEPLEDVPA